MRTTNIIDNLPVFVYPYNSIRMSIGVYRE